MGWLLRQYCCSPLAAATWIGFWALLHVTCATYVLTPMRDAIALAVGVDLMPQLTLASTVLAFRSSVPIGWLFEAPDPNRRLVWKRMGLTRGETQGTSLALFYRCFALILLSYAIGFPLLEWFQKQQEQQQQYDNNDNMTTMAGSASQRLLESLNETLSSSSSSFSSSSSSSSLFLFWKNIIINDKENNIINQSQRRRQVLLIQLHHHHHRLLLLLDFNDWV